MNIVININENNSVPLYVQLYEGIRKEISEGRIEANTKMPSIRQMAKNLNMSKTTIENTYHQLIVEGYIYSKEKKGYYVSEINHTWLHPSTDKIVSANTNTTEKKIKYNLTNTYIEDSIFNETLWKKTIDKVISEKSKELLTQNNPQGEMAIREEIVKYIYQARGVFANTDQVIIGAGVQPLLFLLSNILSKFSNTKIGFEDPGFNRAKDVFINSPLELIPIDIKKDGIDMDCLSLAKVHACYISPSHQFPTGTVMPINKRSELIHWAESENAYIIEDDYNSEIRYQGRPIPSLQGLNRGERVVYLGSFSTVFLPSIRISYMILPYSLLKEYNNIKGTYAQTASKLEQLAIANYMKEGHFEKHIRRLKVHYSKKNEQVKKLIQEIFKDQAIIKGGDSGFNLYIEIKTQKLEKQIKEECIDKGIILNVLSDYTLKKNISKHPVIILSYKGIILSDLKKALEEIDFICFEKN
ncbi:GntR family transcriptional regulator [Natranaerovirga pectinivora]|uniref:GntR family transcriptional regulator n=1 Tax=Natranaerovirga pectinivora TaxID=682400 RepID=A0A4R3MMN4_9FIRM|nr:PLP-dependent aminotransferase family protein [Natranaerovirga pectinivora]TCT14297.1 GntR family transcriptional regulator [Natranaerovirga pectinivora]